jgi:hypothetical protein
MLSNSVHYNKVYFISKMVKKAKAKKPVKAAKKK